MEKQTHRKFTPPFIPVAARKLVTVTFTPRSFTPSQVRSGASKSCCHNYEASTKWVWRSLSRLWTFTLKTVFCAERQPDQKWTFCKLITPRRSQHAFLPKASSVGKHTQTQKSLAEPPNCRPLLLSSYFCFPECMSAAYFCNVQLSSKKDQ